MLFGFIVIAGVFSLALVIYMGYVRDHEYKKKYNCFFKYMINECIFLLGYILKLFFPAAFLSMCYALTISDVLKLDCHNVIACDDFSINIKKLIIYSTICFFAIILTGVFVNEIFPERKKLEDEKRKAHNNLIRKEKEKKEKEKKEKEKKEKELEEKELEEKKQEEKK